MAYIGNNVQVQGFTPAIDYFNGDAVTVTFTLSRPIASVAQVIVAIDNVVQNSSTAYSVSGNSITFTSAPLAGSNNIWVQYTSPITTYAAISQDPSVIGDITATGGYLAVGDFGNTYTDGTIVDYVTGMARITTGPADGLTIYNGGTSARTALMSITSAGKVGIGTTNPYYPLQVGIYSDAGSLSSGGNWNASYSDGTVAIGYSSTNGDAVFGSAAGSKNIIFAGWTGATNAERMRIDSSGNVLISTTDSSLSSGVGVKIRPDSAQPTMGFVINTALAGSNYHLYNTNATNNGYRFYVKNNGGIDNYSGNNQNLSDERSKENIERSGNYLEKICSIPVKTFNYKNEPAGEQKTLGVIAQDVEAVAPELVSNEGFGEIPDDGIPLKSIYQTDLTFALMKAIQELKAEVDSLKAQLESK